MATEIERKFLVRGNGWRTNAGIHVVQGYLSREKEHTVRIRLTGTKAFISVKSTTVGASRPEFEYEIPVDDGEQLLKFCTKPLIEKTRHIVEYGGITWEIDEFHGVNTGLVIAEVELKSEEQSFERPPWLGTEVTEDPLYYNSNLIVYPYSKWQKR